MTLLMSKSSTAQMLRLMTKLERVTLDKGLLTLICNQSFQKDASGLHTTKHTQSLHHF